MCNESFMCITKTPAMKNKTNLAKWKIYDQA